PVSGGGGPVPLMGHVIVVVEENTDYSSVIGSSSMPYLNGLAQQYALATQYYADTHPSIGNYFMMTVGKIITNDDSYSTVVSDDTDGGGHVPCVIVSPKAKRGYQGVGVYQHQSLLRLTGEALGLRTLPNAAATAPAMGEFFQTTGTP